MSALEVKSLVAGYGGEPVLHGVDLTVAAGSVSALLGESGSGKSTLLRVVAGLHRADGGLVSIDGHPVDDGRTVVPPERRGVGLVPQSGALFPHLDVAGNIAFGLRGRSRRQRAARVDELLDLTGLGGLGHRMPHQISGGQRQRVALARALAPDPHVVLLDEPFTALDAALRASLRGEVLRILRAAGSTALLVTHDQVEAMSIADEIAVLRDGRIEQVGSPVDIYREPSSPWVGGFVGDGVLVDATSDGASASTPFGRIAHRPCAAGPVQVLVRPEQVRLDPDGTAMEVVAVEFHGHDALVTLSAPDVVLRARVPAARPCRVGEQIRVVVTDAVVFPAGP